MCDLQLEELNKTHVKINHRCIVLNKIKKIFTDGKTQLTVISDFDRTITKFHSNGIATISSINIFQKSESVPKDIAEKLSDYTNQYRPIQEDKSIPVEERLPCVEEWWSLREKLFSGICYSREHITKSIVDNGVCIRDGTENAFHTLCVSGIPVLIFSAGLGNVICTLLDHYNINYANVQVVSNFFKFEHGRITGFEGEKRLHPLNKHEHTANILKELSCRRNIILLGDSLSDAEMVKLVPDGGCILKIGYLNENIEQNLPDYLEKFDIVLLDDQTMNLFNEILCKMV